LVILLSKN